MVKAAEADLKAARTALRLITFPGVVFRFSNQQKRI